MALGTGYQDDVARKFLILKSIVERHLSNAKFERNPRLIRAVCHTLAPSGIYWEDPMLNRDSRIGPKMSDAMRGMRCEQCAFQTGLGDCACSARGSF